MIDVNAHADPRVATRREGIGAATSNAARHRIEEISWHWWDGLPLGCTGIARKVWIASNISPAFSPPLLCSQCSIEDFHHSRSCIATTALRGREAPPFPLSPGPVLYSDGGVFLRPLVEPETFSPTPTSRAQRGRIPWHPTGWNGGIIFHAFSLPWSQGLAG